MENVSQTEPAPSPSGGKIYAAILRVMKKVEAVGKDGNNTSQGFKYRKIDDVYNMLHTILAEESVFTVPTVIERNGTQRQTKSGGVLNHVESLIRYRFFTDDGSYVDAVVLGEGMDSGDKAANKAMASAHKYAVCQTFMIPTAEAKDPEEDSHDLKPPQKPAARPTAPAKPAATTRPAVTPAPTGLKILTDNQIKRLHAIARGKQWNNDDIHDFIDRVFSKKSAKEMTRTEYDLICQHIIEGKPKVSRGGADVHADDCPY